MLWKSLLGFVPFCVVWWIVRRIREAHGRGFAVLRWSLREWRPVARHFHIDTGEGGDGREGAECAEEVNGDFQVSPWNNRLDGVWGTGGQDGGSHAVTLAPILSRV